MVQNMLIQGVVGDPTVYLNGEFGPLSEAKISVLDRGFIFGDGIYEVVPVYHRKPFRMAQHLARLERSLSKISIAQPHTLEQWQSLVQDLIDRSPETTCMVYLQITRGVAKRDHAFPVPAVTPTVFGMVAPMSRPSAAVREKGVSVVSIPDERWLHCDIKSVSLLGNVLAKQAAVDAGVDEVIQFRDGNLTEAASCNIWMVKGGKLLAPLKNNLVLEGVRYGLLEELCKEVGIPFELRTITRAEVESADELMLSSATREILPIVELDGKPVSNGLPGIIYRRLSTAYDMRIAALA
jgi:D-alanine transaminase